MKLTKADYANPVIKLASCFTMDGEHYILCYVNHDDFSMMQEMYGFDMNCVKEHIGKVINSQYEVINSHIRTSKTFRRLLWLNHPHLTRINISFPANDSGKTHFSLVGERFLLDYVTGELL